MNDRRHRDRGAMDAIRTGWRSLVRDICWTLDLEDERGDPSIMKVFAALFAVAAVHGPLVHELKVTNQDIALALVAPITYFGYRGLKLVPDILSSWRGAPSTREIHTAAVASEDAAHKVVAKVEAKMGGFTEVKPE